MKRFVGFDLWEKWTYNAMWIFALQPNCDGNWDLWNVFINPSTKAGKKCRLYAELHFQGA